MEEFVAMSQAKGLSQRQHNIDKNTNNTGGNQ
jgi:hypothetical protein